LQSTKINLKPDKKPVYRLIIGAFGYWFR